MKKIIPVILVTFLSFSLLYACGGSTESLVKPTVVSSPPVNQSNVKIQKIPTSSPSVYSGASTSTITRPNVTANQSSKPTAVIGDVNWEHSNNIKMKHLMEIRGFHQLIKKPTFEKGSLIDHIYVNECMNGINIFTEQVAAYYTDHDIVTLFIPKK